MKNKILTSLLLVLSLCACRTVAQTGEEKKVLDRVEAWRKAVVGQDVGTLEGIFADEMSYGHSNGHMDTKASFVSTIKDKKEVYNELNLDDMTVRVVGKTAIVRHRMTGNVSLEDGSTNKPNLGVLQVWTKTSGNWQLLARQAFKL